MLPFTVLRHRKAGNGRQFAMHEGAQLMHDSGHPAGVGEVLHEELARGLEVDQGGNRPGQAVEVVQFQLDTRAPGNGEQVDHSVGGTADGGEDDDGVLERRPGQEGRQGELLTDELDNPAAGQLGQAGTTRVSRRPAGAPGQLDAERLGHASHGRCGAHGHAVTGAANGAPFEVEERFLRELTSARRFAQTPQVGA